MLAVDCTVEQFCISQNRHTTEEALQYEQNCLNERLKMSINIDQLFDGFLPRGSRDGPDLEPGSTLETPIHGRSIQ